MNRRPLPPGTPICMQNGGRYIIDDLISSGGFSLVYSSHTEGGTASFVIKEFFPLSGENKAPIAFRDGTVVKPIPQHEIEFQDKLAQFQREGLIGGTISGHIYQTIAFQEVSDGYALMKRESNDMISLGDLLESWKSIDPLPYSGVLGDKDPFFIDLVRVGYALRVVESLLAVLTTIHSQGFLHLDLNKNNVIWAGLDRQTGRNCAAFVSDYGSSVKMTNGSCPAYLCPSYSVGFSAPEVFSHRGELTPSTDLYSVAMIMFYLCCGDAALELGSVHFKRHYVIQIIKKLRIPVFVQDTLFDIIVKSTSSNQRYQSAAEMQAVVRKLINTLPVHPINPDYTTAFTLYSLKSMLTGSRDTHYNWAVELCDRRKKARKLVESELLSGLTWTTFRDDMDFLKRLFPEGILRIFRQWGLEVANDDLLSSIMSCNYDNHMREKLCAIGKAIGMRELVIRCRTLLDNEQQFYEDVQVLYQLLEDEGKHLRDCMNRCNVRDNPFVGLALITMFALLGPDEFGNLIESPGDALRLFPCT